MTAFENPPAPSYGFRGAVQFLTRIPAPTPGPPALHAAVMWFPTVGAIVGALVGAVVVLAAVVLPMSVAAALGVLAGVLLTGAFHEDGLADVADAFAGGWTREERLRILRDPLHGSYGVAALTGSIVIRVTAVASLGPATAFAALVAAHSLGRSVAVGAMRTGRPAVGDGLGAEYLAGLRTPRVVVAVISGLTIGAVAIGWWVLPASAAAIGAAAVVVRLANRRIGGISGDVLGAVEQVAETAVLLVVVAAAARWQPWWR